MQKYIYPIVLLCAACTSTNNAPQNVVCFSPDDKEAICEPQDLFSSIQVIPLHGPDAVIVNTEGNLIYDDNKFYFIDSESRKCVDIFDINGTYLSSVASSGRSETEYLGINSAQLINGLIAIYSYHNKAVYYYNTAGSFIKKDLLDWAPRTVFKEKDYYWGYTGFSNGLMPERVVKIDGNGHVTAKYLPSSAAIIPMSERETVFTSCDSVVLIRESLRNEILAIDKYNEIQPFLKFDFGEYNIPPTYFTQSNPYAAATHLLESDFATVDRFFINKQHAVVGVNFQFGSQNARIISTIGVSYGNTWHWLKAENDGPMSLFHSSLRGLTVDSYLIFLAEKERIDAFAAKYSALIGSFEYSNDNPYLVLCKLK